MLSSDAVVDKVKEAFAGQPMVLVETNLSHEQEDKLREVFAEDDGAAAASMPGPRAAAPAEQAQPAQPTS